MHIFCSNESKSDDYGQDCYQCSVNSNFRTNKVKYLETVCGRLRSLYFILFILKLEKVNIEISSFPKSTKIIAFEQKKMHVLQPY